MTILFIVIAIAFTLIMSLMMLWPFLQSRQRQLNFEMLDEELRLIESLVSRKVALIQALRDTEYDWKTNKISEEDYLRFKKSCERQALGVMRRLEALHGAGRDWDAVIDRAVEERLSTLASEAEQPATLDAAAEDEPWDDEQAALICDGCSAPIDEDDRFCSKCGRPVEQSGSLASEGTSDDFQSLCSPPRTSEVTG